MQRPNPKNVTLNDILSTEALSHALIANLPGGAAFVVDRDLRYVLAEGEALATAGFKPEDLVGRTIFEALPPDLAASYEPMYRQALAGEPFEHEHQAHEHTYISRGTPLRAENGEIYAVLVISYDITERKQAEQQAPRESEARLQSIANLVPDLLWDSEPSGSTNWYNQRWMEYTGQTFEQAIGWGWMDAIHPDDREGSAQRYREAVEQGMPLQQEHRIRRHDGIYRWFVVKASPLKDESGKVIKMYGAATDIHDQRVALETLRDESEAKYRSLFESINDAFARLEVLYDDDHQPIDCRFLEVSPSFEVHTTLPQAQGKTLRELIPSVESGWFEHYHQALVTNAPVHFEMYQSHIKIWFEVDVLPYGNPQDRQVTIVFQNINERKRVEQQQAFLLKFSDALRAEPDADSIGSRAVRMLAEHLSLDRVWLSEVFEQQGISTVGPEYHRPDLPPMSGSYRLSDYPETMQQIATQPMVIPDVANDPGFSDSEKALLNQLHLQALLVVALRKGQNQVIWAVAAAMTTPRRWSESERLLLEEVGERVWAAVERARAEANLREAELQRVREQSAREQEQQRAETLAELDRAKTLFFSNISHEFRTPLTLSLAPLQDALSDPTLADSQREQLELVHRNSLRLLKLVNTLLDFSRIEAGRMEAVYEPTDLATYTAELSSVFRSAIERAGLRLVVDCPPLPEPVFVDREMWEKIVLNLLSNAFKFTFEGEITVFLRAESRVELQPSTVNSHDLTSDPQSPNSELDTLTSELGTASSELDTASSELETSTSELDTASSELDTASSELDTASSELETSTSELEATRLKQQATTSNLRVVLKIRDTGAGIASEHLSHLFERFYQVRGTPARTHEGSGIGLALVHELVRLHGGTIEVNSTLGEGTCFTIALPFGTEHLPGERLQQHQPTRTLASTAMGAVSYVKEAERWLPTIDRPRPLLERREKPVKVPLIKGDLGGSSESEAHPPSSALVLLVDDNADMREYLTRILSEHVQVEAVADGVAALAVAQEQVPDLILSDVMMPGLDGFELLRALRADPRTREIPIILLSARAGEEAIVEGLAAGADDYLVKPFSAQELISRVTTHLQMAQLRGAALQQERTLNRQKDEFISVVSHELNTPLVSILGWTRMLRSSPSNPVMLSKALDTIERNATLQAKLVQELLDLSRISAGKFRLNPQPIELQPVIETAIATVTQSAIDKDIYLTWQENVTEPVVVMGDSDRLGQVLINLLTNAIKFTPEFGSIRVGLQVIGNRKWEMGNGEASNHFLLLTPDSPTHIQITVSDTGIGIPADFLPHVFDRFSQAQGANTAKGLGLGLAIAHHIVELHHGTIHADSAGEGQGATFIVRLPLLRNSDDLI